MAKFESDATSPIVRSLKDLHPSGEFTLKPHPPAYRASESKMSVIGNNKNQIRVRLIFLLWGP